MWHSANREFGGPFIYSKQGKHSKFVNNNKNSFLHMEFITKTGKM